MNTDDWFKAIRRMDLGREPTASDYFVRTGELERNIRRLTAEDARRRPELARARAEAWAAELSLPELRFYAIAVFRALPKDEQPLAIERFRQEMANAAR
jgi:hypothetical protein